MTPAIQPGFYLFWLPAFLCNTHYVLRWGPIFISVPILYLYVVAGDEFKLQIHVYFCLSDYINANYSDAAPHSFFNKVHLCRAAY